MVLTHGQEGICAWRSSLIFREVTEVTLEVIPCFLLVSYRILCQVPANHSAYSRAYPVLTYLSIALMDVT